MPKRRYHFNPETLQYEQRAVSPYLRALRILLVSSVTLAFGFILMLGVSYIFDTPEAKSLQKDRQELLGKVAILQDMVNSATRKIAIIENRDNSIYRTIFEADSIPLTVRKGGVGGAERYTHLEHLGDNGMLKDLATSIDQLTWRAYMQSKSFDDVTRMAFEKDRLMHCIPAIQPVAVRQLTPISSTFGVRHDPITKQGRMHSGVDFVGAANTPIHSTGDGIVITASYSASGYGNQVIIDHGFGYKTRYAHMNRITVKEGERVKRGQIIGAMGSTGRSTGTHLHYEVLVKNHPVDPLLYFNDMSELEYELMLSRADMQDLD